MTEPTSLNAIRAEREGDNRLVSPTELLEDVLSEIRSGEIAPESIMVIALDHGEDGEEYNSCWWASNLRGSEMVALMHLTMARLAQDMGY